MGIHFLHEVRLWALTYKLTSNSLSISSSSSSSSFKTMAALEAVALSIFSVFPSSSSKSLLSPKPLPSNSIKLNPISYSTPSLSLNFPFSPLPLNNPTRKLCFELCSAVQEASVEEATPDSPELADESIPKPKLFVVNFPWSTPFAEIKSLFAQCGTVEDIEMIRHEDGRRRGYAFVTMGSVEEAQAAIEKFDSYELSGRIIRVHFAKRLKKPSPESPPPPKDPPARKIKLYKLYAGNLAWKVRSTHLRELFSASFNPISTNVVFASEKGSSGYGFVGFATKEEAEAALSALDGKELMGRPLRLALSEKNDDESLSKNEEEDPSEGPPSES